MDHYWSTMDPRKRLTLRRSERTRRANRIRRSIVWNAKLPDTAWMQGRGFWPTLLVEDVRKLVRIVRDEWQWLEHGEQ